MELSHHYADVRPAETYADRRVLIIGKQNSGFELATGLLPWARQLIARRRRRTAKLSVDTQTLVGVRARYVQPYEDHVLGGGVSVLDAAIDRIERAADGRLTRPPATHRRRRGPRLRGRRRHLRDRLRVARCVDLPDLGVATFGAEPAAGPDAVVGERHACPGIFFAGTIGQGAKGLQKHGVPANSGRRPRRALQRPGARRPTSPQTRFGIEPGAAAPSRPTRSPGSSPTELAEAPELFHQRGYLARVLDRRSGRRAPRRRRPAARPRPRRGRAPTRSRRPSRPTARARSTRSSTPGSAARSSSRRIEPDPLMRYDTTDARRTIGEMAARIAAR